MSDKDQDELEEKMDFNTFNHSPSESKYMEVDISDIKDNYDEILRLFEDDNNSRKIFKDRDREWRAVNVGNLYFLACRHTHNSDSTVFIYNSSDFEKLPSFIVKRYLFPSQREEIEIKK